MPYTPPSQQSPASSKHSSPAVSRSSSYSEEPPRSPITGRPRLPRSHSSASYMSRQRRSPSITSEAPPTPTETPDSNEFPHGGSIRQSPSPVNNLQIPTGAVISPPDSSEDSDGEDGKPRGRELEMKELKEAVRSIDFKRESSPDTTNTRTQSSSEPVSETVSPTALSAEARKISHSRSSTETALIIPRSTSFDVSPTATSDDSDDDDGLLLSKPSLVRKKSGELVKPALRPSSRRRYSSMPGTPTYSKSVHFNDNDNQTRHFLQVDKPMAVSAGTSPIETYESETEYPFEGKAEREITLANFPIDTFERKTQAVRVERIFLSSDKETLVGSVAVQNISFHKLVIARFTLDYWKTTSEVVAEFNNDPNNKPTDGCDRFSFQIKLSDSANVDKKTLLLCVRYNVNGQDHWDNNDGRNYQVDFEKSVKKSAKIAPMSPLGARPLNAIPRSRHSPPSSSHGRTRQDSTDDEFGARFDMGSTYQFGSTDKFLAESGGSIKLKPKSKRGSIFPTGQGSPHNNLGGRYDFGVSLSAALSSAQDKLGRNSGLMNANSQQANGSYFGLTDRKQGPTAAVDDKPEITGDRPAIGSDQYRDLVQKFCYFTPSGAGKTSPPSSRSVSSSSLNTAAENLALPQLDKTNDDASVSSDGTSSPPSSLLDGSNDRTASSPAFSPFVSRSCSPSPVSGQDYIHNATSPTSFGYPYHSNMRDGYFDPPQLTAIRG